MTSNPAKRLENPTARWAMRLSLWAGVLMLAIKTSAYQLTHSAAILSDAAESVVHIVAVAFAAFSLRLAAKPADETHPYGHARISFFSAGFEGAMIALAAVYIIYESIDRWIHGLELANLGLGVGLTFAAALINGALGGYLIWLGKSQRSLILEANGKHVLTDCWTSIGVLVGLGLTLWTGWLPFDPICAIVMAINILYSGGKLIKTAFGALMDTADPEIYRSLVQTLDRETAARGIEYHELRHRPIGDAYWVDVHLVFPQGVLLEKAHRDATEIEDAIDRDLQPTIHVSTHLESDADHDELHPNGETLIP